MKLTLEDLKPYNPAQEIIDMVIGQWDKEKPLRDRMYDLHVESLRLLKEIEGFELELRAQKTLLEVWEVRSKIAPIRSMINKNDEEIKNIIHQLAGG